jgi:hypothetical protein
MVSNRDSQSQQKLASRSAPSRKGRRQVAPVLGNLPAKRPFGEALLYERPEQLMPGPGVRPASKDDAQKVEVPQLGAPLARPTPATQPKAPEVKGISGAARAGRRSPQTGMADAGQAAYFPMATCAAYHSARAW